jgi:hypothetical protein
MGFGVLWNGRSSLAFVLIAIEGVTQGAQLAFGHCFRHRERVLPQHLDVFVEQWRQVRHAFVLHRTASGAQQVQGCLELMRIVRICPLSAGESSRRYPDATVLPR